MAKFMKPFLGAEEHEQKTWKIHEIAVLFFQPPNHLIQVFLYATFPTCQQLNSRCFSKQKILDMSRDTSETPSQEWG